MLVFIAVAFAEIPEDVRPVLAPADAPAQFQEWLEASGRPPARLACREVWPDEALVCFRTGGGRGAWVTEEGIARWGVTVEALVADAVARGRDRITWERIDVDGLAGGYAVAGSAAGWTAVAVLEPQLALDAVGGGAVQVAVPVDGVVVAWKPGDPALDRVVAVGVRKMYDAEEGPVTPRIYRWDGTRWRPFGQARPRRQADTPG